MIWDAGNFQRKAFSQVETVSSDQSLNELQLSFALLFSAAESLSIDLVNGQ